jgi:FlaA1/EpsC-like NDP-sugar epimerase
VTYQFYSKTNQYIIDGAIAAIAFFLAYQIRFEGDVPPQYVFQFWGLLPLIIAGRLLVNTGFGTYRRLWRYVSVVDVVHLTVPYALFSSLLIVLRLFLPDFLLAFRIPLSVIVIEALISFPGALGVRLLRRIQYQRQVHSWLGSPERKRVLLVGAGAAGVMTANMLASRPDRKVVGFLDDDPKKQGAVIAGVPVLGPLAALARIVDRQAVSEVTICLARAPRNVLKRIWQLCEGLEVRTLIIPALDELIEGEVRVSRLRQVNMEELLGRETVDALASPEALLSCYQGKRILITGAGGSIGSELTRQLIAVEPGCLLLLDKDENGLYELQNHFASLGQVPPHELLVGDIRSRERVRSIFERFRPHVVFHAAAHKHVHLMEANPAEAVVNNVLGTWNLIEQAVAQQTSLFVFVSTDKAVRPSSVMGASKRMGELLVQSQRHQNATRFACVRFGNVMSSRGSVIPLFQKQIAQGGPVTLTDPEVSRYFMTIPEAVQLVIQVGVLNGENGSIYVLDMKDPIRVADLVRDLIELSGLRPQQDIRIETIGLRPGEKLHEELVGEGEELTPTEHPRIFILHCAAPALPQRIPELLERLREAAARDDMEEIHRVFRTVDSSYKSSREPGASSAAKREDSPRADSSGAEKPPAP